MTDKAGGLLDSAEQAIRLERIEGDMRLLTQRISSGMENVSNTLSSVQSEVRSCNTKVTELAGLQGAHDSNRLAIDKVERSLGDLRSTLEKWFDDFDARNDKRWEQYETNRDQWRREHEADNENMRRDLEKDLRGVRDTTIRFAAFALALGVLGSTIVGGFIWSINYRFGEGKEDVAEARAASTTNRNLYDKAIADLNDIKLYLARGGRIPAEPYVPPSQREPDERARKP